MCAKARGAFRGRCPLMQRQGMGIVSIPAGVLPRPCQGQGSGPCPSTRSCHDAVASMRRRHPGDWECGRWPSILLWSWFIIQLWVSNPAIPSSNPDDRIVNLKVHLKSLVTCRSVLDFMYLSKPPFIVLKPNLNHIRCTQVM